MRDDDDRAREVKDGFLKDVLRADVEVIRRLVEDEEVCGAKEELDKGYTTTLTPTEDGAFFSDSSPPNIKAPRRSLMRKRISPCASRSIVS